MVDQREKLSPFFLAFLGSPDAFWDFVPYRFYSSQVGPDGLQISIRYSLEMNPRHERIKNSAVRSRSGSHGLDKVGFRPFPYARFGVRGDIGGIESFPPGISPAYVR